MSQNHLPKPRFDAALFCLGFGLVALTAWIYWPGLGGPFLLDDYWNLSPMGENGGLTSWDNWRQFVFGNTSGPTGRPVSMLSFAFNATDWPASPRPFKLTNLIIHLLGGISIGVFVSLLSHLLEFPEKMRRSLPLFVMAIWLLHPLNVSTTLYVVQRMTQLMMLFAMLALIAYLIGRRLLETRPTLSLISLCLALFPFGLLSVLSKENGALLLLLIVVMESTVFRTRARPALFRWWYGLGVLLPLAIVIGYSIYSLPNSLSLYEVRPWSMAERLLTQLRVLVLYLLEILLPNAANNGLFHDDLPVSTSLFEPLTTLFAGLALAALVSAAFLLRKSQPVFALGVFWFLALHSLESTYLPLELYFEHRNYLAMVGVLFTAGWALHQVILRIDRPVSNHFFTAGLIALVVITGFSTAMLTRQWGNGMVLVSAWKDAHPESLRAHSTMAEYLVFLERPDLAMEEFSAMRELAPNEAAVLLQTWNHACEFDLETPVSLEEIAANGSLIHFGGDLLYQLQVMLNHLVEGSCEFPELAVMEDFFERLIDLPLPDWRIAGLYVYFSDLYVHHRRLDPALINMTRAFEQSPNPRFPLRQANLSASAGSLDDALVFIDRAKAADRSRNPLLPSMMEEIEELEDQIRKTLAGDQPSQ